MLVAALGDARDGVIDRRAVRHDPNGPDQIVWAPAENPAVRFLFLRMANRSQDGVQAAGVRFYRIGDRDFEGFRDYDMEVAARFDSLEYRTLTLPFEDDPVAGPLHSRWRGYRLWLDDGSDLFWLGADSLATGEEKVRRFENVFRPTSPGGALAGTIEPAEAGVSDRVLLLPGWVPDAVFYWIDVDRFANGDPTNDPPGVRAWGSPPEPGGRYGGDLAGVIQALPYLDSLGVNAIVLSPITPPAGDDPRAPVDLKSIDPRLGDETLFRRLVQQAHARRIRVLLHGVFNQLGERHAWFQDAAEWQHQSDFWSFFRIAAAPLVRQPPNYACRDDRPELPLWNTDNIDCRDELLSAARWWMAMRVDGWLLEGSETQPAAFWETLRETVKAFEPSCYLVGDGATDARRWLQGRAFDAVVDEGIRRALLEFVADSTRDARWLDEALGWHRVVTADPYCRISFNSLTTPDTPRLASVCGDAARRRLAAFLQMVIGGAPVIYYGEELGMVGADPVAARACWSGNDRRLPIHDWYRDLVRIRREHPALRRGSSTSLLVQDGRYVVLRRSSEEILLVVVNRSDEPMSARISLPRGVVGGTRQQDAFDLITGSRHAIRSGEVHLKEIPAMSGAILQLR